ncbi:MAG TPA: ABC transporter permease [Prosthecobacter sp.]
MKSIRPWSLFRLAQAGIMSRSSCWLLLLGAGLFAWLAPLLTPWEENPQIFQPARAQAAWIYAWLALFTWLPYQASALGARMRRDGVLEHLRAGGMKPWQQCLQLSSALWIWAAAVVGVALLVCLVFTRPARAEEAALWAVLVCQYGALYFLCAAPLLLLGVCLGTRTAEVIAFLVPAGLLLSGLFGAVWLAPLLGGSSLAVFKSVWLALPHYHLADLTPRLVFKMGPLNSSDFFSSAMILLLQGVALSILGRCLYRTRS